MSNYKIQTVAGLHDPVTGALVGFIGQDGKEYLFPAVYSPTTNYSDASAAPGAVTMNTQRGKVAIAAAAASVVVTNSLVTANSQVICILTAAAADATLTNIVRVAPAAGSFTVYGNAAATAAVPLQFFVVN